MTAVSTDPAATAPEYRSPLSLREQNTKIKRIPQLWMFCAREKELAGEVQRFEAKIHSENYANCVRMLG